MHLSIDVDRPLDDVVRALVRACASRGLVVRRSTPLPESPSGRRGHVIELADPLPDVPHAGAESDRYPVTVFETAPGRCRISTLHPTAFVDLLGHPEVAPAALAFEKSLHDALAEAADKASPS